MNVALLSFELLFEYEGVWYAVIGVSVDGPDVVIEAPDGTQTAMPFETIKKCTWLYPGGVPNPFIQQVESTCL